MIYPIVAIGDPVLKTKAKNIAADLPATELKQLIADMYETMYSAHGVGLAAPQIGKTVRLFVMDSGPMVDLDEEDLAELEEGEVPEAGIKRAFINPQMVSETGEEWGFEEGCLSIPGIREQVTRSKRVTVKAQNVKGESFEMTGEDLLARAFLHETDHLNGRLYISHVSVLKRDLIRRKIKKLAKAGEWK